MSCVYFIRLKSRQVNILPILGKKYHELLAFVDNFQAMGILLLMPKLLRYPHPRTSTERRFVRLCFAAALYSSTACDERP